MIHFAGIISCDTPGCTQGVVTPIHWHPGQAAPPGIPVQPGWSSSNPRILDPKSAGEGLAGIRLFCPKCTEAKGAQPELPLPK